jgi:tRNA pseudouridine38-40 synthase
MIISDAEIVEKINQHLPECIRVWGYVRTLNGFHAKNFCDSRVYEYVLPTFVLEAPKLSPEEIRSKDYSLVEEQTLEEMKQFRVQPRTKELFNQLISEFKGTKNYHNYTQGKNFKEPSSKRHIISINCSEPFIKGDYEWLNVQIHGQSFMIYQIRKMIGN